MAYEDLFKDPYWAKFKREYERKHGVKIDLKTGQEIKNNKDTTNYKKSISAKQPIKAPVPKSSSGFVLRGNTPAQYTGPNFRLGEGAPLKPGYSRVQYYPSTTVLNRNTPTVPYDYMKNANRYTATASESPLFSRLKSAGKYIGPAFGLGQAFMGTTPQSKILGLIGGGLMLSPHPLFRGLGMGALTAAGAVDTFGNPQSQIDKSNRDFAEYEAAFGTSDNPNLNNLAPGLKPLNQEQQQTIFDKFNAQQYQAQDDQFLADPYVVQKSIQQDPTRDRTTEEMNFLTENYNALKPEQPRYTANQAREELYNPTPALTSMVKGSNQAMQQAATDSINNVYSNLYGQGASPYSQEALQNYMSMIQQQNEQAQAQRQALIDQYQQAKKADIRQSIFDGIGNAISSYNRNSSLVFIPSGFNPNGGQTFTPMYLNQGQPAKQTATPTNVDRFMEGLKFQQELEKMYPNADPKQLARINQAVAQGNSLKVDPNALLGDPEMAKAFIQYVISPQVTEAAKSRGAITELTPTTYSDMLKKASEQVGEAEIEKLKQSGSLAQTDTQQANELKKAWLTNATTIDKAYLENATKIATQGMANENAIRLLKEKGFSDLQLAQLKADLESSDPIKQVNAAAQFINAMTNTATPQEAANYQQLFFPGGVPQFGGTPRQ